MRSLGESLLAAFPSLAAFIHEERDKRDNLAAGERRVLTLDDQSRERPEAALLHVPLGERLFGLDAASFFQVNTGAAQILVRVAGDMLAPRSQPGGALLDLYCGVARRVLSWLRSSSACWAWNATKEPWLWPLQRRAHGRCPLPVSGRRLPRT